MSYEQRRANLPQCPTCSSPNKSTYWGFCADEACQTDRWHKFKASEAQGAAPQQRNELLERALNLAHEWSAKFPLGGAMDTIAASQVYAAIEELRGARVEPGAQPPQDAHESAESRVIEKLGVSWKRQNSALTVHVYEPNFKVESLVPLDKDYRAHFAMDAAWKKLVEIEARSTPSPDQKGNQDEMETGVAAPLHSGSRRDARLYAGDSRTESTLPAMALTPSPRELIATLRRLGFDENGVCIDCGHDACDCGPSPDSPPQIVSAPELAQKFHEAYERLAPEFGYETRKESAKPWAEVPENNRQLMTAVCEEILKYASSSNAALQTQVDTLKQCWKQEEDGRAKEVSELRSEVDGLREALRETLEKLREVHNGADTCADELCEGCKFVREAERKNCQHPVLYSGPGSGGKTICSSCGSPDVVQVAGTQSEARLSGTEKGEK